MANWPDGFWEEEARRAYDGTARVLLDIFLAGGKTGTGMLPTNMQVLLDWDLFNQAAVDFLNLYKLDTVANLTETTRKRATQLIDEWIRSGEHLDRLVDKLTPWLSDARARRIAVTEVTRTYAAGNMAAWRASSMVEYKVWQTGRDERVCPICGPLHNSVVALGGSFAIDQNNLPRSLALSGADFIYFAPPAHVNCRCYLKPQISETAVRERLRKELNE
jgi:hypothetical protein